MKCPVCNCDLAMGERLTFSIDYCPQCRGIWPDKGKLDKIIERSAAVPPATQRGVAPGQAYPPYSGRHDDHHDHHDDDHYDKKKRKKGFLEEIFD